MPSTRRAMPSPAAARRSMLTRGTLTMANSAATNSPFSSTSARMTATGTSLSIALLPLVSAVVVAQRRGEHGGDRVGGHRLHLQLHAAHADPLARLRQVAQRLRDAPAHRV